MKTIKDIKSISILGRRWFQRLYGNTYCTAEVSIAYKDGELETLKAGPTYGYGEYYNQLALEVFKKHFKLDDDSPYLTTLARKKLNKVPCFIQVVDVRREKDL